MNRLRSGAPEEVEGVEVDLVVEVSVLGFMGAGSGFAARLAGGGMGSEGG